MTYELRWTRTGRLELVIGEAFVEDFDNYGQAEAFMIDANLPIPACPPRPHGVPDEPADAGQTPRI